MSGRVFGASPASSDLPGFPQLPLPTTNLDTAIDHATTSSHDVSAGEMSTPLSSTIYNAFFRKNTAMLAVVFTTAFGLQMGFDSGSEYIWNSWNQGRQWKDIKQKYLQNGEDDDE